jgi:hypothetical protein
MSFFKHVGKTNNKKVIIVQRVLPGEEHMAVVIYSDIMPSKYHDDVMKILESEEGQASWEFKDILERRMMGDGTNMMQALSSEGYLKRVPAANVIVTPNSKSSMRLDELTKLLAEAGRGEDGMRRLERMEANQGYNDPAKKSALDSFVSESVTVAEMQATSPAAPAMDQAAMMMEMMKTMQAMQAEIKSLKGDAPAAKKPSRAKAKTSA